MSNLCSTLDLTGTWELRDEILGLPLAAAARLTAEPDGWQAQPVPGDIHQGLLAAGRIQEPLLGLNSFDCQWTENRSWWFRRRFSVDEALLAAEVIELSADGLDANAELFLNGRQIGSHRNAFRPFVLDVKPWLQAGENVLLIRLTTGVETVSEADLDEPDGIRAGTEAGNGRPERGEPRRTFVRKPQYSFGWDWSPRVATTAIAGAVTLRGLNHAVLRRVNLVPRRDNDTDVTVRATLTVEQLHYYQTADAEVALRLTDATGRQFHARQAVLLRSGLNYIDLDVPVPEARLWWPNGLGEAHLYRVEAELTVACETTALPAFDWGLRFLDLDTDGAFAVVVNGCRVFCKGIFVQIA